MSEEVGEFSVLYNSEFSLVSAGRRKGSKGRERKWRTIQKRVQNER